ncbi:uncharacterized protein LOC106639655 [Copidosoma floridanum]|uniref:uncharacterized protein LOC106639655 n=1 Tax=Copidosoma floridanum TaxID=29053 RepID=UPI0006C9D5A3|nr:uncharacterized protein LOC106639655 [Copidosoma floridanum]
MPAAVWDWCNSLQRSVQDLFKNKEGLHDTPYLSAIQALKGKTPGSKRAELNALLLATITDIREKNGVALEHEYRDVPAGLVPLARAVIGNALGNKDLVIESLESEDPAVNKVALAARWFFDGANSYVSAQYFTYKFLPRVSLRTRRAIARNLARSLLGHELKAEQFFEAIADAYGYKLAVPLLVACSPGFVYDKILEHKIILTVGMLDKLYDRQPSVALRYLQLANPKNEENARDRKIIDVRVFTYDSFVPKLVKKHPRVFQQLYELTPDRALVLSKTRAGHFLRSLKDVLVEKPRVYLKLLPLELVSKTLDREQFERMFENLFDTDREAFDLEEMLDYLDHYEHGDRVKLIVEKYREVYKAEFPIDKWFCTTQKTKFAELLSAEEREALAERNMQTHRDFPEMVKVIRSYLPPGKLLPGLKSEIRELSNPADREAVFVSMVVSCKVYRSPDHLLEVLNYYHNTHKNERMSTLGAIFQALQFHWATTVQLLDDRHWGTIMRIIGHVHAKGELFSTQLGATEWILENAARYYLSLGDESSCPKETIALLLAIKVEHCFPNWNVVDGGGRELERRGMELMFSAASIKYPESHEVWKDSNRQVSVALEVLKSIDAYNKRHYPLTKRTMRRKSAEERRELEKGKWRIELVPWLESTVVKLLSDASARQSYRKRVLRELVEKSFPEFYASRISDPDEVQDIESGRAMALLRHDPRRILLNWEAYLQQAVDKLSMSKGSRAARRFIAATKWHSEIPVRFVERSVARIKDRGYVIVLGILLEGDSLGKILLTTLDNVDEVLKVDASEEGARDKFAHTKDILQALKLANPPILLGFLLRFVNSEFIQHAESTLTSLAQRVSAERMSNFSRRLTESPKISAKKLGIRLYKLTAPLDEYFKFLKQQYEGETNPGLRFVVTKMILRVFEEAPNQRSWELARNAMRQSTANNLVALSSLFDNLGAVHRLYLSDYVAEYLDTVEVLAAKGLPLGAKNNIVSSLIESLDAKRTTFLSEEVVTRVLTGYFFNPGTPDVNRVAQRFAVAHYLLPAKENAFPKRLQVVAGLVKLILDQYGQPDPDKPGYYPADESVHKFFVSLVLELEYGQSPFRNRQVVDSFLKLLQASLKDHQALPSRIRLSLYREYMLSRKMSAEDFGSRCVACARHFVDKYSNVVTHDVARSLKEIIGEQRKAPSYQLGVVEGLTRSGDRVGSLLAVLLLGSLSVDADADNYEAVIALLRGVKDDAVQAYLDMLLSGAGETWL